MQVEPSTLTWAVLALAAALLTSFNPILYKRMVREAGPVIVLWGVIGLALQLLALTSFASTPVWPRIDGLRPLDGWTSVGQPKV